MIRLETWFILRLNTCTFWCEKLSKRLSRKDFLEFLEIIHEEGPVVKYKNPDAWIIPSHLYAV
jgi:hypothetical protein